MPTCPRCAFLTLILALLAFTGCDTNNPGSSLNEVAGVYTTTTLFFNPEAPGISDVDVLGDLRDGDLRVEIFEDGQATLSYEPLGGARQLITATARASSRTVTLAARTDADAIRMTLLLLPPSVSFARDEAAPTRLDASLQLSNVDLEAYDPATYPGVIGVDGRLEFELERTND